MGVKTLAISVLASCVFVVSCNDHNSPTTATGGNKTTDPNLWTVSVAQSSIEGADDCVPGSGVPFAQDVTVLIGGAGTVDFTFSPANCPTDCVPFHGTLQGDAFTASADLGYYSFNGCGHLQATGVVTGTFSADLRNLTATEVDTYTEPSGHQVVIRSTWTGSRKG